MQSAVNWALLGLVIERPSYAYELAQRFERTYEGVLSLSSVSHAYTALGSLRERGLVEGVPGTRKGRHPKPSYKATTEGMEHYCEWLLAQVSEDRRRQRLFLLQLAPLIRNPHAATEILDRYERVCLTEATTAVPARGLQGSGQEALLTRLAKEEQRLAVGAKLEWLAYARAQIRALSSTRT